ncbi:MAG: ABC transporter ATP-binding protein [Nocardioides sp.]|uniref:ABC transporter ATP-binding protein n=1 Tax=Nocardioides sp. TaxID=35761 RepID=UPI000C95B187|nr:ABC transporter ATP-binding protein [Nocardioides sp.]MAS55179.1 sulfate ABC transporter ATP-binding protein [Pimelobacter sp.]MDE0777237.1 ABC transporter ATP-binding protein [Nocardioides sp.]
MSTTTTPRHELAEGSLPARTRAPAVSISEVSKDFGRGPDAVVALHEVDLLVERGEFVCLLGASGCGKSTLLNLVAGLDSPTSGTVDTAGNKIAFMFQEATLFPWLTLGQNVDLALRLTGVPRSARPERVEELLEKVRLGGRGHRRPHELSGGMRQRGALARVLAQDADIVLMDEPFAALDAMTRDAMHDEIEGLWAELGLTVLFVTHNVREAVRLSDRTVLMESGPGRVKEIHAMHDLPRPRHLEDQRVTERAGRLTHLLKAEVARHVR